MGVFPVTLLKEGMKVEFAKGSGVVVLLDGKLACEVKMCDAVTLRFVMEEYYSYNNIFNKDKVNRHVGEVVSVKY